MSFAPTGTKAAPISLTIEQLNIDTPAKVASFFPKNADEIIALCKKALADAERTTQQILAIPKEHRQFANTFHAADSAQALLYTRMKAIWAVFLTHHNKDVRECAQINCKDIKDFMVQRFDTNPELYRAYQEACDNMQLNEVELTPEQSYYLSKKMRAYQREGILLEDRALEEVKQLKCHISYLEGAYRKALNEDTSHLWVSLEHLQGLSQRVIDSLERNGDLYKLTCDYPIYLPVIETCQVEKTRREMLKLFLNRGGSTTLEILDKAIAARDQLAKKLGYPSFADYDVEDQMAEKVATVQDFLDLVVGIGSDKAREEVQQLLQNLPEGVSLSANGKIKPWDYSYIIETYRKKFLNIDESQIQEYFPLEKTLEGIFKVYETRFKLNFEPVAAEGLWDPAARMYAVRLEGALVGHLVLDLFPREGKYKHACCEDTLVPCENGDDITPAIAVVIANFTPPSKEMPALLEHSEVETLFHELGHALHQLLGSAEMPTLAGYHTLIDFLELPSQLLEEFAWEPETLKLLSSHYRTGETLPQDLIEKKIASRYAFEGLFTLRQMLLAFMSLEFFKAGESKDTHGMAQLLKEKIMPFVELDPEDHREGSFIHLLDYRYASKYYSYHWTQVFAKDIYAFIQKDPAARDARWLEYRQKILEKGGGIDPNKLMQAFLGRAPSTEAYRKTLLPI